MTEPSSSSNTTITTNRHEKVQTLSGPNTAAQKWRTEAQQHIYSAKLIDALRRLRRRDSTTSVREAADRVLAVSARGSTRWSRAMLVKRRINKSHKRVTGNRTVRKPEIRRNIPVVHRKVRVLSRLVPGCRKLSLPNLLEETTDYIAALEMQVKALTFITSLLS